jgi:hypothetical protein
MYLRRNSATLFWCENLSWDIRLVVWRKFNFLCGTALSCLCVTQTTAFSCYGFQFIYMHASCVSCNWERRSMGVCDSVIVVLITLWKLKFLAYLLNVTQRFVMRIISYANVVYFAVGNVRPVPQLFCCRMHGAAQGRKRKTLQLSKQSRAVCWEKYGIDIYYHLFICHTTHFRCQIEFVNFHILILVWSLNVVSCITIRVAFFFFCSFFNMTNSELSFKLNMC